MSSPSSSPVDPSEPEFAPPRSLLYVPGHRRDLAEKALASEADAIILDLEDAVPAAVKAVARETARDVLATRPPKPVWVRLNDVASGLAEVDAAALAPCVPAGIRLPKVQSVDDVRRVAGWLPGLGIHCLIESALGLERAFELATAHRAVTGLALGEADLRAALGVEGDDGLLYARSRCIVAARAAGLPAPVQSVFAVLGDSERLRRSTEAGRRLGFFGRSAIHPGQVPVINAVFTPTDAEVDDARRMLAELGAAHNAGAGGLVLADGRFVDRAVAASARRTLAVAERQRAGAHT